MRSRIIDLPALAILLSNLSGPWIPRRDLTPMPFLTFDPPTIGCDSPDNTYSPDLAKGAVGFLLTFTGPWPEGTTRNMQQHWRILQFTTGTDLVKQGYDIPDSNFKEKVNRGTEGHNGIFCDRVIGSLSQLDQTIRYIKEVRLSAVVVADVKPIVPSFNIFRLSDFVSLDRAYSFLGSKDWTEAGMKAGKYYKGITIFQMILYQSLHQWASGWSNFLAELDRAVTIKVCAQRIVFATKVYINTYFHIQPEDILNHEKRNELMLDDRELKKSDLYFEALQLLRYMT